MRDAAGEYLETGVETMGNGSRSRGSTPGKTLAASGLLLLASVCFAGSGTSVSGTLPPGHPQAKAKPESPAPAPIDLNSASKAQLKTLYGIGDAEADRIVAARPFLSKADIVPNAGIPAGIYIANKRKMIALQKTRPSPKG